MCRAKPQFFLDVRLVSFYRLDAEVQLLGGSAWEAIELSVADFKNAAGEHLISFDGIKELRLNSKEILRGKGGQPNTQLGGQWQGADPVFNDLHWSSSCPSGSQSATTSNRL